jgi:electron transfer flavoprotein beta subunit
MRILVCIKQVPDSESPILINRESSWIQTEAIAEYRMNRLDEFALEEAVLIKENRSGTKIDTISVGPDRAQEVIKRSIGMGADAGIHVVTDAEEYQSSFETAARIAEYARRKRYDLILAGVMSEDNMQGQVGPMIARRLALPCATAVISKKIAPDKNSIYVEREIEGGHRDTLELQLPAVLTIQSGINTPRYPSLSNLLRANRQRLEQVAAADLAPVASHESLVQMIYPHKSRSGDLLEGTDEEKAAKFIHLLRERALLP